MNNPYENNEIRKGKRVPLGVGINTLIHELDESDETSKKAYRTAKVQNMFKDCCEHIYGSSAFLVLQNINAVYIFSEADKGMLKKARPTDKKIKRLAIYTNDSIVYSDLDSRQEMIKLWFNDQGERIDKLELFYSKFNMRRRYPYKNTCELMKNTITAQNESQTKLVPPKNPDELKPMIDKINDDNLKKAINKLIYQQ